MNPSTAEEGVQQAGTVESAGSNVSKQVGVNESVMMSTVPAAFVEQAATLHTAARLCMAMAQAAQASFPRLVDPIAFLGEHKLWILNEV